MPEHVIRLRGGWLWYDVEPPGASAAGDAGRRVTLPIAWPVGADSMGGVRLVRSFGAPPLDGASQAVSLRLAQVGGLASARLNGREIARPAPGTSSLEIPLPWGLLPRNTLVLEVNPSRLEPGPEPWGMIALAIASRAECD